jgi:exodeoxyribonuclease V beta subunit
VIEASAGTGKTFTLEHLVVDLVLREGTPLESILVVTFTEKAAQELQVRLRAKLRGLLEGTEAPAAPGEDAWRIDETARARLAEALVRFDRATIATIHAFCQRVLTEHAFVHRRPFSQTLVDGRAAFERAFVDVLRTELAREEAPRRWLEAWLDTASLRRLVELGWTAASRGGVLSPRFDSRELERGLAELRKAPTHFRAVRPMLVRGGVRGDALRRAEAGLRRLLELAEVAERSGPAAFLQALEAAESPIAPLLEICRPAADRQPGLRHLAEALDLLERSVAPFASAVLQVVLPRVTRRLQAQKALKGELDFSDMLRLVDESLAGPSGEALARALRERYAVALIDEFQDTDPVQWSVFRRLFLAPGAAGRLFVIGDPKQAIYGFRGADVGTYLEARDELLATGGTRAVLGESFRASPPLLDALNCLFDPSAPLPFFPGAIDYAEPVRAGRPEGAALLEPEAPGPAAVLLQPALEEAPPGARGARKALAGIIGDEIASLLDSARTLIRHPGEAPPRPLLAREIFVLTRSAVEGREIAELLAARGLPAALYKQEGLFQSPEAHDVRALLAAVADPHRPGRALRAWRTPFFGVPLERLPACTDLRASDPLVARLLEWSALADARDYPRLFARILEQSGITERLVFAEHDRALTNHLHLFEILQAEARDGRPPIGELLDRFTAFMEGRRRPVGEDGNVERLESDRDAVQVMTMHKSKGLEAEVVFLYGGLTDPRGQVHPFHEDGVRRLFVGREPPERARKDAEEETRRLAYVALTRARTRLYVPFFGAGPDGGPLVENLGGLQALLEPHLADQAEPSATWALRRRPPPPPEAPAPPDLAARLADWRPPPELLERPRASLSFAELRSERWGPIVTSYSRMKGELGSGDRADRGAAEGEPASAEELSASAPAKPPAPEELPPGAASGRFLHEVLERVDVRRAAAEPDPEAWSELPEVRAVLDEALARHRRRPLHRAHGARLVHAALTAPLCLGSQRTLHGGLADADRWVREMEFLFTLPAAPTSGFVKGFIDVVLEVEGRLYVLDWKSDDLASHDPDEIDRHVRAHYLLQAEIYAVAAVRMAGIASEEEYEARFGGALYVFLRGLGSSTPGAGQWFRRPSWRELLEAAARLEARPPI